MLASKICNIQGIGYSIGSLMRAGVVQMAPIRTVMNALRVLIQTSSCLNPASHRLIRHDSLEALNGCSNPTILPGRSAYRKLDLPSWRSGDISGLICDCSKHRLLGCEMVRIQDMLDTATLDTASTSATTGQDNTIGQGAFEQHLDKRPHEQQASAGPSHASISEEVEGRLDAVNQQPDLKLVVISNRIAPYDPNKPQAGGLAARLEPVVQRSGAVWIGSAETPDDGAERPLALVPTGAGHVARLDLPAADHDGYYRGYSNSTLRPALHSLPDRTSGSEEDYGSYRRINDFIARAAFDVRDSDAFWVHDYHLLPLGAELNDLGIERPTGSFFHTPWPMPDMIECVPNHRELMKSMLKYDLLGFQTNRDLNKFLAGLRTHFGLESKDGVVTTERGQTRLQKVPNRHRSRAVRSVSCIRPLSRRARKSLVIVAKNSKAPSLPSA